ncbi:hypothetical protein YC2023_046838 [Brassica napus]
MLGVLITPVNVFYLFLSLFLLPIVFAFCPNNNEVHIYKSSQDHWEMLHVLEKHDQIVSGIDWSSKSNKIVTVSHDRNSYVWSLEGGEWVPTLVILRLNRAALCVQWSPKENKFAVGSGAKTVCICYYEQENNWWVSKLIRKRHESSVTNVAWHPNNVRTINQPRSLQFFWQRHLQMENVGDSKAGSPAESKFGEQILQLDLSYSWAFGHSSMIYFVDDVGPSPLAQSVAFRDLPLRDVGVGYDSNPMIFAADDTGIWCVPLRNVCLLVSSSKLFAYKSFIKYIGEKKAESSSASYSSQKPLRNSMVNQKLQQPMKSRGGVHDNCINSIVSLSKAGSPKVMRFSTSVSH